MGGESTEKFLKDGDINRSTQAGKQVQDLQEERRYSSFPVLAFNETSGKHINEYRALPDEFLDKSHRIKHNLAAVSSHGI